MDFTLDEMTPEQNKALAGWYKHFTTKYTIVGKLKEYEGWDFSSVEELAKSQTPFGAPKTDGASTEKKATAFSGGAKPAEVGVVFAKGDRVTIRGVEAAQKEFEGAAGVLQGFNPKEGGFEVALDGGKVEVFKPAHLAKA
eukprot:SRR837773.20118.p3 GENE.SRR837773.20118~~SRR837773.20118.p3  ORF type:complete len:156 (-),score=82.01 SRR837773.20118:120-539(-)